MSLRNFVCVKNSYRLFGEEDMSHGQRVVVLIQTLRFQRCVHYLYESRFG